MSVEPLDFSELLRDLWVLSESGQFLDQHYGHGFFKPLHDHALGDLLDRIEAKYQNEIQSLQDLLAKSEELLEEKRGRIEDLEYNLKEAEDT